MITHRVHNADMPKVVDEPHSPNGEKRVYIFCPGCKLLKPKFPAIHCMNVSRVHCTHPLRNQTIELLDVPPEYLDGSAWKRPAEE